MPREGHDANQRQSNDNEGISIHVPREGHDPPSTRCASAAAGFQSTCPARGTTRRGNPRPARNKYISIHVPREGHDPLRRGEICPPHRISIHVPREGHDIGVKGNTVTGYEFQSTCPARGTTAISTFISPSSSPISIHVPREGHDAVLLPSPQGAERISIHVPREGHDRDQCMRR